MSLFPISTTYNERPEVPRMIVTQWMCNLGIKLVDIDVEPSSLDELKPGEVFPDLSPSQFFERKPASQ